MSVLSIIGCVILAHVILVCAREYYVKHLEIGLAMAAIVIDTWCA